MKIMLSLILPYGIKILSLIRQQRIELPLRVHIEEF